jgi:mxaA protein
VNRAKLAAASLVALALCGPGSARATEAPALPAAQVQQPRAFGYVLGDVITQRVLLESAGAPFQLAKMPGTQRVGIWLERRAARVESAKDNKRWLIVEYQLINAPRILTTIAVPPLLLESSDKTRLLVPAWSVSVSPLTPQSSAFDTAGMGELRPDRPAALVETTPVKRQVWIWCLALAATVAAWAGWTLWRNRLAALNQPFARAWHEMRRLDSASPQAWQTLHRAFDRTAGRVMHAETLPLLFDEAPHLQPLRARIEEFFAASSERFFGAGTQSTTVSIQALCDELQRMERRHER